MKLAPGTVVADEKVRDYLLNPAHPQNRGKAALFTGVGFARADWPLLALALRRHAIDNLVVTATPWQHGKKYVVTCNIVSPDGRNSCLTSVWAVDNDRTTPHLVTAYGAR